MNLRIRLFITFLLAPALLVLLAVVLFPFVFNVILSFSNANLNHIRDWRLIGFAQYVSVFKQQLFWSILLKTVIWTMVNIVFHVAIGVFLAVVLHQKFIRGKSAWRIALILPWALPQYISALTWRGMFNYEYGSVNLLITKYLHLAPVQWLTSPFEAFLAVIITNIWLGFPFMMVIALGWSAIDPGRTLRGGRCRWRLEVVSVLEYHRAPASAGHDPGDLVRHNLDI